MPPILYLFIGNSNIKSNLDYKAKRIGDKIYIYGKINHDLDEETYQFDPWDSGAMWARPLQTHGKAKEIEVRANMPKTVVVGTIDIKDGKPVHPRLEWFDDTD